MNFTILRYDTLDSTNTEALNQATRHLAEITMNRSVREALAGKNVKDV